MPRPDPFHAPVPDDLADLRDVVGGVNAMLDALLVAALPVLTRALAGEKPAARARDERADEWLGL